MAQRALITLISDPRDGWAFDTVVVEGQHLAVYDIDLEAEGARGLRRALEAHLSRVQRERRRRPRPAVDETLTVREWARAAGYEIGDSGRIPARIWDAYNNRCNINIEDV